MQSNYHSSNDLLFFLDIESTGPDPKWAELISMCVIVTDQSLNKLGEFYEECRIEGPRIQTDIYGKERNMWPDPTNSPNKSHWNATDVHKILWEQAQHFQKPIDFYRKLWIFLQGLPKEKFTMVFHSNTKIDPRFLFYRSNLHAPPLYQLLVSRSYYYEPDPINASCAHRLRYYDTMSKAQEYIRNGKNVLKQAEKLQKTIDKNMNYLTKVRKYPAKQEQLDKWKNAIAVAKNELSLLGSNNIQLEGYSLDKICRSLNIPLRHHDARSDTAALLPIYKFLTENL